MKLTQRERILLKYVLPKKKLRVKKRPKSIGEALGDSKPLHSPLSLKHQKFENMNHLIQLEEKLDDSIEFVVRRTLGKQWQHEVHQAKRGVKKKKGSGTGRDRYDRTEAYNRLRMKALMRNRNYKLKDLRADEVPSSHMKRKK